MRPNNLFSPFFAALVTVCMTGCDWSVPRTMVVLRPAEAGPPAEIDMEEAVDFLLDLESARAESRMSGRPLLVFFESAECVYCRQMREGALADPQVVELSKRFVCLRIGASKAPEICGEFRVQAYPTLQFESPQGVALNRLQGMVGAESLASHMEATLRFRATRTALRGGDRQIH